MSFRDGGVTENEKKEKKKEKKTVWENKQNQKRKGGHKTSLKEV